MPHPNTPAIPPAIRAIVYRLAAFLCTLAGVALAITPLLPPQAAHIVTLATGAAAAATGALSSALATCYSPKE